MDAVQDIMVALLWWDFFIPFSLLSFAALVVGARWHVAALMAGYAGSQFLMSVSKRYPKCWPGAFVRRDSLKGAVFADSPLVRSDSYFAAGVGIAWILTKSSTLVEAEE